MSNQEQKQEQVKPPTRKQLRQRVMKQIQRVDHTKVFGHLAGSKQNDASAAQMKTYNKKVGEAFAKIKNNFDNNIITDNMPTETADAFYEDLLTTTNPILNKFDPGYKIRDALEKSKPVLDYIMQAISENEQGTEREDEQE